MLNDPASAAEQWADKRRKRAIAVATTLLWTTFQTIASDALAQAARPTPEDPFFEELPILTVTRLPQSVADTPGAVTVFDRDFIRATGYRDVARLLRLVPGIGIVNDRAHTPLVTYHGIGGDYSNRMQVLIDGRSVYSPSLAGGADWSGLPITIDEIERVEVLRGSNSTTYGSNAFLGVVNIITRHSRSEAGNMLALRAGERGTLDASARHAGGNDALTYRVSVEWNGDRGYEKLEDNQRYAIGTLRADLRLNPRDELSFWAGGNDGKRENGFAGSASNGLRTFTTQHRFAHLRWRHAMSTDSELAVGYYRNDETIAEPLSIPGVDVDRQSTRDNLDFQHTFKATSNLRVVWGAEVRRDWVQSRTAFYPTGEAASRLWRGFVNTEWRPLASLVVNAGAMEEKYHDKGSRLAPRVFANWTPIEGHTFRAGWTRAYREPALFEEHGDLRIFSGPVLLQVFQYATGGLRPERVLSRELGWVGQYAPWRLTADLRAYWENVADPIEVFANAPPAGTTPIDPRSRIPVNLESERAHIRGVEAQLKARPTRATDLLVGTNLGHISSRKLEYETSMPTRTFNATWIQRYGERVSSTLSYVSVSNYRWIGSAPVASYWYVDARIAYRFRLGGARTELALGVQDYGPHRQEFQLGASYTPRDPISRLFYASTRIEF